MTGHYEFAMLSQSIVELSTMKTARKIWQDIANSQCCHNPVSSSQKEIYDRTLRIRNVITIRFRAYSKQMWATTTLLIASLLLG